MLQRTEQNLENFNGHKLFYIAGNQYGMFSSE